MIGQMNSKIILKSWGSVTDEGGGSTAVLTNSYSLWAKVEDRSGTTLTSQAQPQWSYDYKITFRYEKSRIVNSNQTIDYDGKRLAINSLSYQDEGNRKYVVARCSTTDQIPADDVTIYNVQTYNYTGVSHETVWTNSALIGKTIIGAFKDGIEFKVITSGIPTGKQVLFDSTTGQFTWSVQYEPGENTLIQFI